jgi:hypothetical protein
VLCNALAHQEARVDVAKGAIAEANFLVAIEFCAKARSPAHASFPTRIGYLKKMQMDSTTHLEVSQVGHSGFEIHGVVCSTEMR